MVGGGWREIVQGMALGPVLSLVGGKKMRFFLARIKKQDLLFLSNALDSRQIVSVIDRLYPLSQTADALRYLEEGHARGKVVITVEPDNER